MASFFDVYGQDSLGDGYAKLLSGSIVIIGTQETTSGDFRASPLGNLAGPVLLANVADTY